MKVDSPHEGLERVTTAGAESALPQGRLLLQATMECCSAGIISVVKDDEIITEAE